jgi:hypothetical protein
MPAQILYQKWKHYFLGPKDLPKLLIQKAKVRGFGFFENLHKSWNSGVIRYEAKFFWDKGVPRECIGGPEYWNDPDRWNDDVWKEGVENRVKLVISDLTRCPNMLKNECWSGLGSKSQRFSGERSFPTPKKDITKKYRRKRRLMALRVFSFLSVANLGANDHQSGPANGCHCPGSFASVSFFTEFIYFY